MRTFRINAGNFAIIPVNRGDIFVQSQQLLKNFPLCFQVNSVSAFSLQSKAVSTPFFHSIADAAAVFAVTHCCLADNLRLNLQLKAVETVIFSNWMLLFFWLKSFFLVSAAMMPFSSWMLLTALFSFRNPISSINVKSTPVFPVTQN